MTRPLAAILAGAVLFAWPALLNGYPILFSDTGGLLEMGLRPSMGWDKPFVYGPLLAALSLRQTLWLPLAAQAVLISYMLWAAQQSIALATPLRHVALCVVLAAGTTAPWFASTLMPDVFTPVVALGIAVQLGRVPRGHAVAIGILTAIAIAAHLSHLVLAAAMIAALAALQRRLPWRSLASLGAALLFLLGSNWIGHGRVAVSPYGSVFALARLIGDGPARDYLAAVCPDAGYRLCAWRSTFTNDSDQFLWDPNGPFWADPAPLPKFAAEASRVVLGTVRAAPLRVLGDAAHNGARQLARVDIGDTLGPDYLDAAVRPRIERWFPASELARYERGRQAAGTLLRLATPLVPLHRALLLLGLLASAALLLRGLHTRSRHADIATLILIGLAANALATGALSTVHDRYEARLAWLVLLPGLLAPFPPRCNTPSGNRTQAAKPPAAPPLPETSAPAPRNRAAASP